MRKRDKRNWAGEWMDGWMDKVCYLMPGRYSQSMEAAVMITSLISSISILITTTLLIDVC